jgi:hypothetical protein
MLDQMLERNMRKPRSTYRKHLIGLIEDEHLQVVGAKDTALDHVVDTARGTDNDLGTLLESLHVVTNVGTTNAGVALNVHEVTDGDNDLLDLLSQLTGGSKDEGLASLDVGVELLQSGDGESGSLSSTGLGLGDDIATCDFQINDSAFRGRNLKNVPLMMGMMARCWIAEGRSKP